MSNSYIAKRAPEQDTLSGMVAYGEWRRTNRRWIDATRPLLQGLPNPGWFTGSPMPNFVLENFKHFVVARRRPLPPKIVV